MTPEAAIILRDRGVVGLAGENERFLDVVQAIPDSKLEYKPEERLMSFARLALHVTSAGVFFLHLVQKGELPPAGSPRPEPQIPTTTAALVEQCRVELDSALKGFRALGTEALVREVPFHGMGVRPGVNYIDWHQVHLIHHRGQMTTYLRVAGEKVPSVYGPTADTTST